MESSPLVYGSGVGIGNVHFDARIRGIATSVFRFLDKRLVSSGSSRSEDIRIHSSSGGALSSPANMKEKDDNTQDRLGFLLGTDRPCSVDAIAFGFLYTIMGANVDRNPYPQEIHSKVPYRSFVIDTVFFCSRFLWFRFT